MPKLKNQPPKYCKINKYAVVYVDGKPHYLGLYGSPESHAAYSRFVAERQAAPTVCLPKEGTDVSVKELGVAFLDHAKANTDPTTYTIYRMIVLDFLLKLYGDGTPVDDFTPRCLKLVRETMVQSHRFCRNTINRHTQRIVSLFEWGVSEELVLETTWRALTAVKSLPVGTPGTFDHPEKEDVPDSVIFGHCRLCLRHFGQWCSCSAYWECVPVRFSRCGSGTLTPHEAMDCGIMCRVPTKQPDLLARSCFHWENQSRN